MDLLGEIGSVLSQELVQAPVWIQMLVLAVVVVPIMLLVAWLVMWVVDFVARRLSRDAQPSTRPPDPDAPDTKVENHV